MAYERHTHEFEPVYDGRSKVLILGSFPSPKSRQQQFYYGHPQNRFWKVLAAVTETEIPEDIPGRRAFLLAHHIALWDVIEACDIEGASDASIRNVQPTDLPRILEAADIARIYVNGQTAGKMFARYQTPVTGRSCTVLPSTSPANAAWRLPALIEAWSVMKQDLCL